MPAIVVQDLCKTYVSHKKLPGVGGAIKSLFTREKTEVKAVVDVSFEIEQGEMVGFLGPNGAGKTTTLKMLSGILYPTSGKAEVFGFTPFDRKPEMLKQIAIVMGNKQQLWWDLPAWDSFVVLKELYEVSDADFKRRVDRLIEELQISGKVNTQVRKLSLGERMKCELVAALLHAPRVVFLDEPTLGLDVVSQKRIREFLKELHKQDGSTVLLTSHYMQDVEELCKRVIVIDHGELVFEGTLDGLTKQFSNTRKLRLTFGSAVSSDALNALGCVVESDETSALLEIPPDKMATVTAQALQTLPVADIAIQEVDIEDVIRELFSQKR
ncbi:MAG: ATP-binding cassette domain-containing protein [Fimbriimonadaceae bacterium]|nr:ATP-binding cassette domain-containing protein [Fimbriimonadaceae bacterium]